MGRIPGIPLTEDHRSRIADGACVGWKRRRVAAAAQWSPPPEFAAMYRDFRSRFGVAEARRLVEDHARVVYRRRASGIGRT